MAYNLHDLKVVGVPVSGVLDCRVEGAFGEHSNLMLWAYTENDESFLYELPSYQPIEIQLDGEEKRILFSGIVTDISVVAEADQKTVRIEAKSHSWLMDLVKKSRSFQNTQITYRELICQVLNDYPGSSVFCALPEEPVGKLLVQYEETDWDFLNRVLSLLGTAVTPGGQAAGIQLYAGIPAFHRRKWRVRF